MKKLIKISCQGVAKADFEHHNALISRYLPNRSNIWKNCEFYFNDDKISEADYWFVIGDIDLEEESCVVDRNNIIFMTGEPESIKRYDDSVEFINQFARVYTSQVTLNHKNIFPCRPPINWWIDAGHPIKTQEEFNSLAKNTMGYDDFKATRSYEKTKLLSVFCSAKIFTPGHKMRYDFCKKLKSHFKDKIDWYGSGVNPIENKWDGIAPYKYHIALENSSSPDYWTEKLMDPYMVLTYPIYCGATNIGQYFDDKQITLVDLKYPKTAIAKIENLIENNVYEKNLQNILDARNLVMDKYNAFNKMCEIVNSDGEKRVDKKLIKIRKEKFFLPNIASPTFKSRPRILKRLEKSVLKKVIKLQNFVIDCILLMKFKCHRP